MTTPAHKTGRTGHTPGPWKDVDLTSAPAGSMDDGVFKPNAGLIAVMGADGSHICEIFPFGAKRWVTYESAQANARLIAAAPDLLKALEGALAFIESQMSYSQPAHDMGDEPSDQFTYDAIPVAMEIRAALSASRSTGEA